MACHTLPLIKAKKQLEGEMQQSNMETQEQPLELQELIGILKVTMMMRSIHHF